MPSATRVACGAGAPAGRGGKCTVFAEIPSTFPGGGNAKYSERGLWCRCPCKPQGKVYRFRRNSRHFPGRERLQVRPEGPVEPIPLQAAGESEPFSRKFPALSPEAEMASAAREACGAGAPAGRGGKCTIFAEKPGTFPGGRDCKCSERGLWCRCPGRPRWKVHRFRRNSRHFPRGGGDGRVL